MKIITANQVSEKQLQHFLQTAEQINKQNLLQEGYAVVIQNKVRGCFILSSVNDESYWLKQLYIASDFAGCLPVLLEMIIQMTKDFKVKKLYVHSHQPVLDLLLDTLQFYQQKEGLDVDIKEKPKGNWWIYDVS